MSVARTGWREVDRGWTRLRNLLRSLKQAGSYVKVGVLDGAGAGGEDRGDLTNAELAAVLEYGTADGHIPARSFVGSTISAKKDKYIEFLAKGLAGVYEGKVTIGMLLDVLGARAANDIKVAVTSGEGIPPPNAPSTVERKGSDRTLVDTGRMIGAVSWLVVLLAGKDDADAG